MQLLHCIVHEHWLCTNHTKCAYSEFITVQSPLEELSKLHVIHNISAVPIKRPRMYNLFIPLNLDSGPSNSTGKFHLLHSSCRTNVAFSIALTTFAMRSCQALQQLYIIAIFRVSSVFWKTSRSSPHSSPLDLWRLHGTWWCPGCPPSRMQTFKYSMISRLFCMKSSMLASMKSVIPREFQFKGDNPGPVHWESNLCKHTGCCPWLICKRNCKH